MRGEISLGWPAKPLWPNFRSRTHWAKTRAVKAARSEAYYATKAAKIGVPAGDVPITIQATFYPPDRRARDYDNCGACLKAHYDGIADALGINDSAFRPERPIIAEPVKGGKVVVEFIDTDNFHSFGEIASGVVDRLSQQFESEEAA